VSYRSADFDLDGNIVQALAVGESCFASGTDDEPIGPSVSCDEPHTWEYLGTATPPFDTLPDDVEEVAIPLTQACRPLAEELLGRESTEPGLNVAFIIDGELGGPVEGDLDCYAGPEAELALSANAIAEGYDAALAPLSVVFDLEPRTCFTFYADSVDIGEVVDCSAEGALMAIGSFEAPDGDWPGSDALRALRSEECAAVLAATDLSVDESTISGTFPGEETWNRSGRRVVTCDASPT